MSAHTSRQWAKVAAWPRTAPSRSMSCQTTPSSIRKRRPDLAMRNPRIAGGEAMADDAVEQPLPLLAIDRLG